MLLAVFLLPDLAAAEDAEETTVYHRRVNAVLRGTPKGLTEEEAVKAAVSASPRVKAKEGEAEASEASTGATLARYLPKINVVGSVSRSNRVNFDFGSQGLAVGARNPGLLLVGPCPNGGGNCVLDSNGEPVSAVASEPFEIPTLTYSLQANASLPLSDFLRLPKVMHAANLDSSAAVLRKDAEIRSVVADTRVAYYEWVRALAQAAVAKQAAASVQARLEEAELGLEAGVTSLADVQQIRSAKASSKNTLAVARSAEAITRDRLLSMMGAPVGRKITLGLRSRHAENPAQGKSLEELVKMGMRRRRDLRALRASHESTDAAASAARFDEFPKLAATGSVNHANPNQQFFPPRAVWNTSWNIGLNISWSLDGYLSGRSRRKELHALTHVAKATLHSAEVQVRTEIVGAWQALSRSNEAVKNSKLDVTSAEAVYEQRVLEFRAGQATASALLDAEVQRFQASLGQLNARIDRRIALAQLRRSVGMAKAPRESRK